MMIRSTEQHYQKVPKNGGRNHECWELPRSSIPQCQKGHKLTHERFLSR